MTAKSADIVCILILTRLGVIAKDLPPVQGQASLNIYVGWLRSALWFSITDIPELDSGPIQIASPFTKSAV